MRRRVWLGAFVGLLLLSATLEAQYGWFTQNGGLIARMSSSATAVTIRQSGSGALLDLTNGTSTYRETISGTSKLLQYSNGGAFSTVGTFTSGGQIILGAGSNTAPSLSVADAGSTGAYSAGAGSYDISVGGTRVHAFNATTYANLSDSAKIQFGAGLDTQFSRNGAAGAFRFGNTSNTNTYDITLADWGTTLSAEPVSVADAGVLTLGTATSGSCTVSYPGDAAIYVLRGTANATRLADGSATFTVTKGNAATVNVYYDTTGYFLQNNTGGTLSFRVACTGG